MKSLLSLANSPELKMQEFKSADWNERWSELLKAKNWERTETILYYNVPWSSANRCIVNMN